MTALVHSRSPWYRQLRRHLLHARQWFNAVSRHVRVLPDNVDAPLLGDDELLHLLHRVQAATWTPQRRARSRRPGEQPSAFMGRGGDFEEARAYMVGDDLRHMEWRATARTGRPYIKVYRQEQQSVLHLIVDRGASMRFGTRQRLKVAQAVRIAMLLAFDAHLANESIGLSVLGEAGECLRPRSGQPALQTLVARLNAPAPPRDTADEHDTLAAQLADVELQTPPGARIVLLSDGRFLKPADLALFARLGSSRELSIAQILDPAEIELPALGRTQWLDLANGAVHYADLSDPEQRQQFSVKALAWQRQLDIVLQQTGAQMHRCMTTDDAWTFVSTKLLHAAPVLRTL